MAPPLQHSQLRALVTAGVLIIAAVAVFSPQGVVRFRELRAEAEWLRSENARLLEAIQRKRSEVELLRHHPRFQARAARDELGYVEPGELLFLVDPP